MGSIYPSSSYSYYSPYGSQGGSGGGMNANPYGNILSQAGSFSAPPKKEHHGFFDKLGAVVKGVTEIPGKLVKGVVQGLTDPKNLLLTLGAVALAPVTGGASLVALGAYGAVKGTQAVAQGVSQVAQGWKTDNLQMIEEGTANAGTGAVGVGLSVVGARAAIKANPGAAGLTAEQAENLSLAQTAKGSVQFIKSGFKGIEGEGVMGKLGTVKDTLIDSAKSLKTAPSDFKAFSEASRGTNPVARLGSLRNELELAKSQGADAATIDALNSEIQGLEASTAVRPMSDVVQTSRSNGISGARDTGNMLLTEAQHRILNSRVGDFYRQFEMPVYRQGGTANIGANLVTTPEQQQRLAEGGYVA